MITNQVIRKCIEDIHDCTGADISVYEVSGMPAASTSEKQDIDPESIRGFYLSQADSQVMGEHQIFRIMDEDEIETLPKGAKINRLLKRMRLI